jgi:hypothetical protein
VSLQCKSNPAVYFITVYIAVLDAAVVVVDDNNNNNKNNSIISLLTCQINSPKANYQFGTRKNE